MQKQVETVVNEDKKVVDNNVISTGLDKNLEQHPCILNVEKYEIHREPEEPAEYNDLIGNVNGQVEPVVDNIPSPTKIVSDISPKESLDVNEKETDVKEEANEQEENDKVQEINKHDDIKREIQKCSPGIDLTSHPAVTFVPSTNNQPETPRYAACSS